MRLFLSLLLVAAVAGQDYTYDYYEPEAVVPEPVAVVPEPAPVVAEPPQNKAVVTKSSSVQKMGSADTDCTSLTVQIKMSDSSSFSSGTAVLDAVLARAALDVAGPAGMGRTFGLAQSDFAQSQATGKVTLTGSSFTEDSADCGAFFKRVGTIAEAQLRVQEAIWGGALASTATIDTPSDVPTVTDVSFTLGGKMITEIGAYDHDEDYSSTTCNATTCVTVKVHSKRYDLPIAEDDGPINGVGGCVAYPDTATSTTIGGDAGVGCYTSGSYAGASDSTRSAVDGSEQYNTNAPIGSLDQSWVSSQYRDDDSDAVSAATRSAKAVVASWKSRNGGVTGQYHGCLDWVAGEWTTVAGRTYAVFEDTATADCFLTS